MTDNGAETPPAGWLLDASREAGFTLVELLVALALLALIAVFVGQGFLSIRSMTPVAARLDAGGEITAVRDHLRRTIREAVPDVPTNEKAAFVGRPEALRFFAPADPLLERGGLMRIDLGLAPGPSGRLDLVERRAPARGEETSTGTPTVLLANVAGLALRFARPVEAAEPDWRSDWTEDGLPALVSVAILLPDGDGRRIAPFLVHPEAKGAAPDPNSTGSTEATASAPSAAKP